MVSANPRNGMPSTLAISVAECILSTGSNTRRWISDAVSVRRALATPAVTSARLLTRKRRVLLYAAWRSETAVAGFRIAVEEAMSRDLPGVVRAFYAVLTPAVDTPRGLQKNRTSRPRNALSPERRTV